MTPFRFETAARSHPGRVRSNNEDAFAVNATAGLWAVADGMGGHAYGEQASRLICERLGALPMAADAPSLLASVESALRDCQEELLRGDAFAGEAGSTVVVLLACGAHYAVLWAGDSRAYLWRDGGLECLTRDHNVVAELVERGELPLEQARDHPWRNRITNAVGVVERLELDATQGALGAGDVFLLCSDGLTSEVDEAEIAIRLAPTLEAAADSLLEEALARGGRDNVTLVLVQARAADPDATLPQG
jgi:protein phosphatase